MTINEKIQALLKEKDISYNELARMMDLAPSSIQSYCSGRSKKIPFDFIEKLSELLRVPIEYWLSGNDVEDPHPMETPKPDKKLLQEIEETAVSDKKKLMDELLQLTEWYHLGMFTKEEFEAGKKFILEMMK